MLLQTMQSPAEMYCRWGLLCVSDGDEQSAVHPWKRGHSRAALSKCQMYSSGGTLLPTCLQHQLQGEYCSMAETNRCTVFRSQHLWSFQPLSWCLLLSHRTLWTSWWVGTLTTHRSRHSPSKSQVSKRMLAGSTSAAVWHQQAYL